MENNKWMKGLSRSTVANVLAQEPKSVEFISDYKDRVTYCKIVREDDFGWGMAICSCLDRFDRGKGRNIAAGRALLALVEKKSSRPVRTIWESYPSTWTKKHIEFISGFKGVQKCQYVCGSESVQEV